jgi:hypothetical protein
MMIYGRHGFKNKKDMTSNDDDDGISMNRLKNAVTTICSNDLLKLMSTYKNEKKENLVKIMFMKYFTTCRVRYLHLLAAARWLTKSDDVKDMEIATQQLQSIHREINAGWPAPMYDVENACDVLGSSYFETPRAIISGLVPNHDSLDSEEPISMEKLEIEVQRRFLQSSGMISNETSEEFRSLVQDVQFFEGSVVVRRDHEFEFKVTFSTKSTVDRARWYVPSLKFLIQADALDENTVLPDEDEITSVRTWMTAMLNDENAMNPMLICVRTLCVLSTKFQFLTLKTQLENFISRTNGNHIEVKDREDEAEDGFDVNVYFSSPYRRKRMLRCTLSMFRDTKSPSSSSSAAAVCCRVSSSLQVESKNFNIQVNPRKISMKKLLSEGLRVASISRLERLGTRMKSKLKQRKIQITMFGSYLMVSTSFESVQISVHASSGELRVSDRVSFSSRERYERILREAEVMGYSTSSNSSGNTKDDPRVELFLDLLSRTTSSNIYEC